MRWVSSDWIHFELFLSTTKQRERSLPPAIRSSQFFSFNLGRLKKVQVCSTAVRLDLIVELVYVKCHGQQKEFSLHLYFPTQEKAPESHVLFEHPEGSFDLDGTVHTQQNTFICFNASFHLHTLPLKVLGNIEVFTALLKGNLTSTFYASFLVWAAITLRAGIHRCYAGYPALDLVFLSYAALI